VSRKAAQPDRSRRRCPPIAPSKETAMRGILLWLLGLPIPIIILLYVFHVI
jgi:hypothetical protein